jgi:hypothetical protein
VLAGMKQVVVTLPLGYIYGSKAIIPG